MYPVSVMLTLIPPDFCPLFQSAQPQSNPIYGCCFSRANPNPTRFMYIFSIGPTLLIHPDLCTFFQLAQSQSNPIYAHFFNRPNPNPTRFMDVVSFGPTLIHPDLIFSIGSIPIQPHLCAFFQSAQPRPNPIFMHFFAYAESGPLQPNPIYAHHFVQVGCSVTFWSGSTRNIHEFPDPTQKADPDHYTRYASAHRSMTGYLMGIS
jgi:hypothetical protein